MAANKDDTDRLASLQSLCSEKDQLIQSLSTDLQVEKHLREHESRLVGQKAARIKQWVVQRLKELEAQNEQLRKQNVTCTAQLQVLKSCAERTKSWRNSLLLSRSVTGALPVDRRDVDMDCNRTSEDSGLTSGDNADSSVAGGGASPPPDSERLLCCSTNSLRTNKHVYATCLPLRERNKAKMLLEMNANGGGAQSPRSRCGKMSAKLTDRTTSLPRDNHLHAGVSSSSSSSADSSPSDEKPIPTPRKSKVAVGGTVTRAYLLEPDILTIERDSLEPDGEFEDDDDDEIFDEPDTAAAVPARSLLDITESMCNLVVDPRGSSLTNDDAEYVNLAEIYTLHRRQLPGPPPAPPVHRSMAPWEEKLHALADKCLERRSDDGRDSLLSPRNSHERSSTRTTSSEGPKDICHNISLPMFTTRHGMVTKTKGSTAASNQRPKTSTKQTSDVSSTDLEPESSPHPSSSGAESRVSSANSSRHSKLMHIDAKPPIYEDFGEGSSSDGDYALPPDAYEPYGVVGVEHIREDGMQTTLVASSNQLEKHGFLLSISDSRVKSLKRRYCSLKNGELLFYKSQKEEAKKESLLMRIAVSDITGVSRISGKSGTSHGFQITTNSNQYQYTTESAASTDEWVKVLSHALKSASIAELDGQTPLLGAAVRGWLTKVKYGHSKRFFAALVGTKLMLFKTPGAKIPTAQLYVKGAHIAEVVRSSDESGNSDGDHNVDTTDKNPSEADYSVSIQMPNEDPIYLVFVCREEKDKWLYYLRLASKDGELYGTPFEVLVQRLMAADGVPGCDLWKDLLITCCEENPKEALTTISEESKRKEAISLAKACYLFTSVLMRSTGVQYHIDLAQNTLQMAMATDNLRNELFAQLIKLTNGAMPYGLQAWKLLGLAVSLFTPIQYALLWLLRKHLERWSCMGGEEANMAKYCLQALQRCQRNGGRKEAPSKLETTSLLTRNPCTTKLPHSITIRTPSGEYQVIEFDGSSLVGECLTTVCAKLSIRQPLLCGYALYSDDPSQVDTENALSPRHKICDAISRWERQLKDCRSGRISDSRTIRLQLRPRYYWPHLAVSETEAERVFLAYRMADELKHGHVPVSPELAEELSALLAQMHYGDSPSTLDADRFEQIVCSFYPAKLLEVACKRTLKSKLLDHWQDLKGSSTQDCARVILGVLRRWRLFGAHLYVAGMRWKNDEKIFIAVNDAGVHLLTSNNLDLINTYPYQLLVNFGGYHDDFMLTVSREVANRNNPEEPSKERLTFSMAKPAILQLTLHIADYIKTRKMVWHASKERNLQSPARRTPRKSPQRAKARKM